MGKAEQALNIEKALNAAVNFENENRPRLEKRQGKCSKDSWTEKRYIWDRKRIYTDINSQIGCIQKESII